MKILIIHTYYQNRGGEDFVFEQEVSLLKENAEVEVLTFQNHSGFRGGLQFFFSIWNPIAAKRVKTKIYAFKPDVVHIHNWHFGSGPIIFRTIKKLKVPFIVTLHNYRLICPSGVLLYKGVLFLKSLEQNFPYSAIKKKVYKDTFLLTFWLAGSTWIHKKIGSFNKSDTYIVLTKFSIDLFLHSKVGIAMDKFLVKPNFTTMSPCSSFDEKSGFLYVGRLSEEKGINILLNSFINKSENQLLNIIGDGPLRQKVLDVLGEEPLINYCGFLSPIEIRNYLRKAEVLIFPSIWYETFGLTIIEAFSQSTVVIASNIGAPASLITHGYNGLLFEAGNSQDLQAKIAEWNNFDTNRKREMHQNAYNTYLELYTPQKNKDMLMKIYKEVIKSNNDKS